MKLELSIADDRELRSFIKDLIRGEIVSIARGEIKGILADVVKEGIVPKDSADLDKIVRSEISSEVKRVLGITDWGNTSRIKEVAREEVQKYIKELFSKGNPLS